MSQKIDIKRTEIKTATVQIKTLVIDNRKFTLATFRQIPEEIPPHLGLFCDVDDFIGKINYDGWWILWGNSELRKCRIDSIKCKIASIKNTRQSHIKNIYRKRVLMGVYFLIKNKLMDYDRIPESHKDQLRILIKEKNYETMFGWFECNQKFLLGEDEHPSHRFPVDFPVEFGRWNSSNYGRTLKFLTMKAHQAILPLIEFEKQVDEIPQLYIAT